MPGVKQEALKLACIGAGYAGGTTMTLIAYHCPEMEVVVLDNNEARIKAWQSDTLPIYEPGLKDIVQQRLGKNLWFSTDVHRHVGEADIVFISVNTPTKTTGLGAGMAADLIYFEGAARLIAAASTSSKIIVEKSTVPVKTADAIAKVLHRNCHHPGVEFEILSNPEFLAEGSAIEDLMKPDRVLIGGREGEPSGQAAMATLRSIYERWVPRDRILCTNLWSAELSKLVANAMLAQRISSINAVSALCEATGADVNQVSHSIGMDSRIGPKMLHASVGFGGSGLQKDVLLLAYLCESVGLKEVANYWKQVILINNYQKKRFVERVILSMFNTVLRKKIAIFGFAFKKNTGDTRETPAVDVCHGLLRDGATLCIYDPRVGEEQIFLGLQSPPKREWDHPQTRAALSAREGITVEQDPYVAAKGAHAICVLNEWDDLPNYDFNKLFELMVKPAFIFDGRNVLNHAQLRKIGFVVYALGSPLDPFLVNHQS